MYCNCGAVCHHFNKVFYVEGKGKGEGTKERGRGGERRVGKEIGEGKGGEWRERERRGWEAGEGKETVYPPSFLASASRWHSAEEHGKIGA